MEKVELSSWLVELVSKTQAKTTVEEEEVEEVEVPAVPEEASSTKPAIEEEQSKQDENLKAPVEEVEEHAWFFEKEFFADKEEAGEGGTKRKIEDEDEDEKDEDEDEDEVKIVGEQKKMTNVQPATGQEEGKKKDTKGHYACYECGALVPKVAYSNRQRKKKTKRRMKCKKCMVDAVGKNVSTEPLTAAQLYMMNKDRFIGF